MINKLNRKVEYALIALKYMSRKFAGQLTTVKEICDAHGCPFDATARVMQIMVQHKLLKSEQGVNGGYMLVRDLSKVSFYELLEMILGPVGVTKCLHGEGCDLADRCNIQSPIGIFNQKLIEFYSDLSLIELLSGKEHHSAPSVLAR